MKLTINPAHFFFWGAAALASYGIYAGIPAIIPFVIAGVGTGIAILIRQAIERTAEQKRNRGY